MGIVDNTLDSSNEITITGTSGERFVTEMELRVLCTLAICVYSHYDKHKSVGETIQEKNGICP